MKIRETILKWLTPSSIVIWLNGKKFILGLISLGLWAIIYGLPVFCVTETCAVIVSVGIKIQQFLTSIGVNLDTALVDVGGALTIIGLLDKIINHWFSNVTIKLFTSIEKLGKATSTEVKEGTE